MDSHDIDRVIGKLEEFQVWSLREFALLDRKLSEIIAKLEQINRSRWVLYGEITAIGSIVMLLLEVVFHKWILGS